jgi:hypothetical protein
VEADMKESQESDVAERSLMASAFFYAIVMLAAFAIGMYGLLSLFWLALSAAERNLQSVGILF